MATTGGIRLQLASALVALIAVLGAVAASTAGAAIGSQSHLDRLLAPADTCPGSDNAAAPEQAQVAAMACLISYARAQAGLRALRETPVLDRAGAIKIAADIRCRSFSHTPCGRSLQSTFAAAGYALTGGYSLGENLAWGQDELGAPQQIMQAWLASPDHRANLLSTSWTSFGLGVRTGTTFLGYGGVALWANEFAGP